MSKKDGTKNCKCGEIDLEMFATSVWNQCRKCRNIYINYKNMYDRRLKIYICKYTSIEEAKEALNNDIKENKLSFIKPLVLLQSKYNEMVGVRELYDRKEKQAKEDKAKEDKAKEEKTKAEDKAKARKEKADVDEIEKKAKVKDKARAKKIKTREREKAKIKSDKLKYKQKRIKKNNTSNIVKDKKCLVCYETDLSKFIGNMVNICIDCHNEKRDRTIQNIIAVFDTNVNHDELESNMRLMIEEKNLEELEVATKIRKNESLKIADIKIKQGNNGDDYIFYVLEFQSQVDKEVSCFKYGITKHDIPRRFSGSGKRFNISIIKLYYGSEQFIKAVERKVLILTNEFRFDWPNHIYYDDSDENREFRTEIDLDLVESVIEEQNIILERASKQEQTADLSF